MDELDYGERLLRYLSEKKVDAQFVNVTDSSQVKLQSFYGLCVQREKQKEVHSFSGDVLWFSELPENGVFMYQNGTEIFKKICECFHLREEKSYISVQRCSVVFAFVRGRSVEQFLRKHFNEEAGGSLYIGLTEFPSLALETKSNLNGMGLAELFLMLEAEEFSENLCHLAEEYENFWALPAIGSYKDLLDIRAEDVIRFTGYLEKNNQFGHIFFECGEFLDFTTALMGEARELYAIISPGEVGEWQKQRLYYFLQQEGKEVLWNQIHFEIARASNNWERET